MGGKGKEVGQPEGLPTEEGPNIILLIFHVSVLYHSTQSSEADAKQWPTVSY